MAKIQGITIELGADASGIEQALKDVNKASSSTAKELGQINRALKFDSDNVSLLSQKFDVLQDAAKQTETKLNALREAQAEVNRQFQAGEIDAKAYRAFNREIEQTEGKLRAFSKQAEDIQARIDVQTDTTGIEKMKAALKELGPSAKQAASEIGNALSTAGTAGAAAVTGLVVGMADTNKDLAMLETQIGQVGLALSDIGNARTTFDSVGQETDQVTEAMGNLIQAGYDTKASIDDISTSLAGAIVKYGDTFNVEGLAESITTTTQLGEVTGQLTDLLEKEGINVENFNAKIQSMSTEQERANYISQLLADQGLTSMYNKYAEGNAEIVNASAAQVSMTDALSELSVALTPLVTKVSEFVTKIVDWANENKGLATVLAVVAGAITALSGAFAFFSPIISAIVAILPKLTTILVGITGPIGIAIAAVVALGVAGVALYKNWDEVSAFLKKIWDGIKSTASTVFNAVGDVLKNVWNSIKSVTEKVWNGIKSFFSTVLNGIKSVFNTIVGAIESNLKKYWDSMSSGVKKVWDGIKQYFSGVWDLVKNIFAGALVVVLQLLTGKWGEAKSSTEQIWNNIKVALSNVWEGLKKVFSGALSAIGGFIKTTWDNIKSTTTSVFNAVKSTISSVWEGIKSTVTSVSQNILSAVKTAFTSLVSSVSEKMSEVKSTIEKWWNQAVSFLKGVNLRQIGIDMMRGLINGIKSMAGNAIEAITGVVDGIVDKAKSLLKIKSPSRVMMEIGRFVGDGLVIGMNERSTAVANEAKRIASEIVGAFKGTENINVGFLNTFNANDKITKAADQYNDALKKENELLKDNAQIALQRNKAEEFRLSTTKTIEKELRALEGDKSYNARSQRKFLAELSQDYVESYEKRMEYVNKAEAEYAKEYEEITLQKFDAQKSLVEELKGLNAISLLDEEKLYKEMASLYAADTEQYKYFQDQSVAIRKQIKDELVSINNDYTSKIQAANNKLIADEKAINDAYQNSVKSRAQSLYSFAGIFDQVTQKTGVSGEQLIANLRSQNVALKDFASTITSLGERGVDSALLDELEALGPKSVAELQALNSLSDDQLNEYVELWREKSTNATTIAEGQLIEMRTKSDEQIALLRSETAKQLEQYQTEWSIAIQGVTGNTKDEMQNLVEDMPEIGANVIQGMMQGLSSMTPSLVSQAESIANAIKSTIQSALDINSPSRVMRGFGVNIGQGLLLGMDDMIDKVAQTSQKLSDAAGNALGSLANSSIKSQSLNGSSSSTSIDNRKSFAPVVNVYTTESPENVMRRELKRMAFQF